MELMRHTDRKPTDKIYTESNLLPLGEVVRSLPDEENLIKILTNISGDSETLVEVAGIEPASRNTSDSASTRVVHFLI